MYGKSIHRYEFTYIKLKGECIHYPGQIIKKKNEKNSRMFGKQPTLFHFQLYHFGLRQHAQHLSVSGKMRKYMCKARAHKRFPSKVAGGWGWDRRGG